VRKQAAFAFVENSTPKAVEPLIRALNDEETFVLIQAISTLGTIGGSRAVVPLIKFLDHDDPGVALNAASALGEIGDAKAAASLMKLFKHGNHNVRTAAASAISNIHCLKEHFYLLFEAEGVLSYSAFIEALLLLIDDEVAKVRGAAVDALGRLKPEQAAAPLVERLHDQDAEVRKKAVWALGRLEGSRAPQPLIKALDEFPELSGDIAWALGEIGAPTSVETIIGLLDVDGVAVIGTKKMDIDANNLFFRCFSRKPTHLAIHKVIFTWLL